VPRSQRPFAGEMNRAISVSLLPLAAALGIFAEWASLRRGPFEPAASASDVRLAVADFSVGIVLVGGGLIARLRRPESWTGLLLAATGLCWFLGTFASSDWAGFVAFGGPFVTLHRGPLAHALLAYPDGRAAGVPERVAIAGLYVLSAVAVAADTTAGVLITASVILGVAAARYVRSAGPERQARLVAAVAATAFSTVLLVSASAQIAHAGATVDRGVLWGYQIVVMLIAVALLIDLVSQRWTQTTVTGLVVDLGTLEESGGLRDRLAAALGDPSLEIGYRLADRDVYVDDVGRPLALPDGLTGREVTILREDGQAVAALLHDGNALADRRLLDSVAGAARIAVTNARLQAEIRSQLEAIESSRRRIVEAGNAQKQRLERQLRHGAERRLAEVAVLLEESNDGAGADYLATLAETREELARAQAELREFARGIHPAVLTDGGLGPALADLVARAPVAVELVVTEGRFPAPVEAVAYFVCSEALTNIGKYAEATRAAIEVAALNGGLWVSVTDDGRGGASLEAGSGLRGLADRVEALGGSLHLDSPVGAGTALSAELPLR
jgi:signal transduction histidine kinase